VTGDAAELDTMLASRGLREVKFVLSSIPFRSLSRDHAARIVTAIGKVLAVGGTAVQYTYSTVPPFPRDAAKHAGLVGQRCALVFANLPPAFVWRYDKHE
jgi:phosphatidylethanolamine/phosphatidyl-N-methylethanolamine N-methyltransferase